MKEAISSSSKFVATGSSSSAPNDGSTVIKPPTELETRRLADSTTTTAAADHAEDALRGTTMQRDSASPPPPPTSDIIVALLDEATEIAVHSWMNDGYVEEKRRLEVVHEVQRQALDLAKQKARAAGEFHEETKRLFDSICTTIWVLEVIAQPYLEEERQQGRQQLRRSRALAMNRLLRDLLVVWTAMNDAAHRHNETLQRELECANTLIRTKDNLKVIITDYSNWIDTVSAVKSIVFEHTENKLRRTKRRRLRSCTEFIAFA